jgi:phosphate transport system permease protein
VLAGFPTIVTGAFVYALWVIRFGFSGLAGSIALSIVMLPLMVRSSEESLRLVPQELRQASLALGATNARTALNVVLPAAASGVTTGMILALARAAGETAPLLLTALGNDLFTEYNPGHRMSTLSLQIFNNAISGFRAAQARAWGASLTLIGLVLVCTLAARLLRARAARG